MTQAVNISRPGPECDGGGDAALPGTHVVARTGAPPIRLNGHRVYHRVGGHRHAPLFVSLWVMRSPGYLLAHSLPDQGAGARTALRVADPAEASDLLETYCAELKARTTLENFWDSPFAAANLRTRSDAFRNLVGQTLADWHVPETAGPLASTA